MPRYVYNGAEPQTYPQYLDVGKGTTLVADTGGTYDVAQVEGLTAPGEQDERGGSLAVEVKLAMPPDGRWSEPSAPPQPPARGRQADNREN